jgi:nucleoside 2-deoxyribosyltransferase
LRTIAAFSELSIPFSNTVQKTMIQQPKHFAFVLMPFDKAFDDIYKLGIKGAVEKFGEVVAERVDEQIYREGILERIYRQIEVADIIIADMSGQNPNVFYEVGFAHAKQKLCILLTANANDIPFDLKHQRHIVYGKSIITLRRELERELGWACAELDKQRTSHVKVTVKLEGMGALKNSKYVAEAEIPFTIDLENTSADRAITIHAIYIYSTTQWKLYQDNKECASTAADEQFAAQGFRRRHFVQPPLQILQKEAWAQVKFNARGILATAFKGEQLQESYNVRGRSVMRIITADGNFDHDISIDVKVDDIPF